MTGVPVPGLVFVIRPAAAAEALEFEPVLEPVGVFVEVLEPTLEDVHAATSVTLTPIARRPNARLFLITYLLPVRWMPSPAK
jgi:hypothetical protein